MTTAQFVYKVATIYEAKNTCFIAPILDDRDQLIGYYPVNPTQTEIIDVNGEPFLRYRFASGQHAAIELRRCGVVSKFLYNSDIFGEDNKALQATMQLLNMQNQGIAEGIKNSATYRFMAVMTNFTQDEDLKNERDFLGVYISGHPLQSCRRVISEVATFRAATIANPEAVDELLKPLPVDKWKKKSNPNLKDERGLKHLDVRMVGILSACTVKVPKPRPDGSVGQKWAILQLSDGDEIDAFCFAKSWEKYSAIEGAVDKLVLLCGEVSRRVNYAKDDKIEKKKPELGDYNFTVREAYPLEDALPLLSKALRIRLRQDDPELEGKVSGLKSAIASHPGRLAVVIELHYPSGGVVEINLGDAFRVGIGIAFLSELAKIIPQSDTSFAPEEKIYLAPPERKPWEG
jgi:DNA polymerase III alpha subunit